MGLRDDIADYIRRRATLLELEADIADRIKEALSTEIPNLNAALPNGYVIDQYQVLMPSDRDRLPAVMLMPPHKDGVAARRDELPKLQDLLVPEFLRIRDKYGFEVTGFHRVSIVE